MIIEQNEEQNDIATIERQLEPGDPSEQRSHQQENHDHPSGDKHHQSALRAPKQEEEQENQPNPFYTARGERDQTSDEKFNPDKSVNFLSVPGSRQTSPFRNQY